jgi:predicted NAD/FAD-binding protein
VETRDSDMTFGVTWPARDFEYSTRDVNGFFATRRLIATPAHYGLFLEIVRFGRLAPRLLADEREGARITLGEFLDRHRFGDYFTTRYLYPLASSIWSASLYTIRDFPAATLIRFFHNHGMLYVRDHPTWRVVAGGSDAYVARMTAALPGRVHTGRGVAGVRRETSAVAVRFDDGQVERFDEVVLACHGDQAFALIEDPSPTERDVVGAFRTTPNDTWLHTDARFLARRPRARSAWNYHLGGDGRATLTYDLNKLMGLPEPGPASPTAEQYCVTLNPPTPIEASKVLARMAYTHPLYTREAIAAQARWADASGARRLHFCGAYWFYGFHEDGVRSAVRVASCLGVEW